MNVCCEGQCRTSATDFTVAQKMAATRADAHARRAHHQSTSPSFAAVDTVGEQNSDICPTVELLHS